MDVFDVLKQIAEKRRAELAQKGVAHAVKKRPASEPGRRAAPRAKTRPAAGSAKVRPKLGAAHFLKFIYNGHAEWTVLAVQAPMEKVTDALVKLWKPKRVWRSVPIKKAGAKPEEIAPVVAVIHVKGSSWTVVYRSLFWFASTPKLFGPSGTTKVVSRLLKTNAICFASEDTSGALGYDLFERGSLMESAEWSSDDFASFESKRREEPEFAETEFVDDLFRELGIYLPVCFPRSQGQRRWVSVRDTSSRQVVAADLLEF